MSRRERYDWEDDHREGRAFVRRTGLSLAGWIVVSVLFAMVLGGLVWGIKVATSDAKGAGDATRITNDGRNRVNSQEMFHDLYNEIRSLDERINATTFQRDAVKNPEDRRFYEQTLTGQTSRCLEVVGRYNAETRKTSRERWRDTDLPYQIDTTDPATDCKASVTPTTTP